MAEYDPDNATQLEQLEHLRVYFQDETRALVVWAHDEIVRLETRQTELLQFIKRLSNEAIDETEAAEIREQVATLIAEVGTLRSNIREQTDRVRSCTALMCVHGRPAGQMCPYCIGVSRL